MKHFIYSLSLLISLCACDDSLNGTLNLNKIEIEVIHTGDTDISSVDSGIYTFRNISTGRTQEFKPGESVAIIAGIYDIGYEAEAMLSNGASAKLRALQSSVIINSDQKLRLEAYCIIDNDDLIISEIFFTGTLQPSGNSYNGDQYIKLYNNTDHVIYADGLTIFESKFLTTEKRNYTPDVMTEAVTVQALYTVPGNGEDHPVQPGEYFLICDVAMDHRHANPNSFDLSHADFEWYDESSKPSTMDIDSQLAPNLDKWYCYTQTVWLLHNRGLKAFGIARIPVNRDEYLADYKYAYDYETVTVAGTFPMSGDAYKLPNEWIVDMITCSVASDYAWQLSLPSIDCGWTSCGNVANDKTRFFKSVRRKMIGFSQSGHPILKDTNNSTADFNASVTASEIELQHTASDASGTPSTIVTYDGIIPVEK